LFLFIDVPASRSLIEPLAALFSAPADAPARWRAVLDKTAVLHAGVLLSPGSAPSIAAVATGRFSPASVSLRLNSSLSWRRFELEGGARSYWRHRKQPLEVAAPECGLLLVSAGQGQGAESLIARWKKPGPNPLAAVAPANAQILQGAAAYLFIPEVQPFRNGWLTVRLEGGQAFLSCALTIEEGADPRSLQNLIRLLAVSWMRKAGLADIPARIRDMQIEVDGGTVLASGLRLEPFEVVKAVEALRAASGAGGGG